MTCPFFAVVLWIVLGMAAVADDPPQAGAIVGTVRYLGEVPPAKRIPTTDGGAIFHNDLVVDPKTKGLRHVAVLLDNPPPTSRKKQDMVVVDQKDMVFLPRLVAIQEGQKVRFENSDLGNHGVQASSANQKNTFSITVAPNQPFDFNFKAQKAPVVIGCQIHPWMRAWVFVLPHPYFAVTDARGSFKINDVPPGKHTLLFAHPDTGLKEQRTLDVLAGKTTELKIEWQKTGK